MHETSTAFLHFDPPLPGLVGGTLLQGWLVPKPGRHYADLRAVASGETFPGVFGIPRRDLAEFFKSDRPCLLAGFDITINLPAGRHVLNLEGLTLEGRWEPLDSLERDVNAAEAMSPATDPVEADGLREMLHILLRRLGDPAVSPAAAAAALLATTPRQRHLRHPPRPFHGHLDQPRLWARSLFGRLAITGWVFHESLPIKRVFATTDLQAVQNLRLGRATDFLAERSQGSALATHCGYDGFLDLPAQLPSPAAVRVYAELADGSWHLGSVARFSATDHEFAKLPLAPFSALTFWRAWRALVSAMKSRGWPGPAGSVYWTTIRQAWRDYSAQAPRRLPVQPIRPPPPAPPGPVHLITHNLSHEGAPLFLLEYARELRRATGATLAVTSAREGPLRREFEELGATVRVVDAAPLLTAANGDQLRQTLQTLGAHVDLAPASLVVANTLSAWWGVHLAHQAGRPVLLYVHESTPPRSFFRGLPAGSPVLPAVESSFRLAGRVSFLTAATQRYYTGLSDGSNYCLHPGWIDLAAIDRFRAGHTRAELRTRLGLAPDQQLVLNVGTVCERKGQHLFARAVERLWQTAPELAASAVFLMIGGRDTPYDRDLADFLAGLNRPNLRIIPESGDVYPYYGAADLFVCSSYEESFPRVVLEAMAFAVPIVSTGVHGIPEMVRDAQEARLVPPGDSAALETVLRELLAAPAAGQVLAARARERVGTEFASAVVLPRHVALARTVGAIS
jgi:glycosyltransferase involved in cell wall biosynthesis